MLEIGSTTDSEFVNVLLTSYVSLLENNKQETFSFNIIDDNLTDDDKRRINLLRQSYRNCA